MNNSTEDLSVLQAISLAQQVAGAVVCGLTGVISVTGHLCLLVTLVSSPRLAGYCNYLVLTLAMTDSLLTVLVVPVMTYHQVVDRWELSPVLCQATGFVNCLLLCVHVLTLCSIAFVRYLRYCYFALHCLVLYRLWLPLNIIVVWLVSAMMTAWPMSRWGNVQYVPALCVCLPTSHSILLSIVLLYGIASMLLLVFYCKVGYKLKNSMPPVLHSVPCSFDPRLDSSCFTALLPNPHHKNMPSWKNTSCNDCMWRLLVQHRDTIMYTAFLDALSQLPLSSEQNTSQSVAEFIEMCSRQRSDARLGMTYDRRRRNRVSAGDGGQAGYQRVSVHDNTQLTPSRYSITTDSNQVTPRMSTTDNSLTPRMSTTDNSLTPRMSTTDNTDVTHSRVSTTDNTDVTHSRVSTTDNTDVTHSRVSTTDNIDVTHSRVSTTDNTDVTYSRMSCTDSNQVTPRVSFSFTDIPQVSPSRASTADNYQANGSRVSPTHSKMIHRRVPLAEAAPINSARKVSSEEGKRKISGQSTTTLAHAPKEVSSRSPSSLIVLNKVNEEDVKGSTDQGKDDPCSALNHGETQPPTTCPSVPQFPAITQSHKEQKKTEHNIPILVHRLGDGVSRLSYISPTYQSSGASFLGGFGTTTKVIDFRAREIRSHAMADTLGTIRKEEMAIGRTLVAIFLSFLLPVLPSVVLACVHIVYRIPLPVWLTRACAILFLVHVALTPITYGWTNLRIRKVFFTKILPKRLRPKGFVQKDMGVS